ncbi:MAG: hypothetical protein KDA28_13640, partial [Phycisphaerales bacterium]|nr:hypothetical protein [Phycisphaerales bacterium]
QVQIQEASSGWAVINNYCHDMRTFLHARITNQGVMAHNYCVNMRQNSAFIHGLYAGPVLVEGNDIEGYEIDRQWGLEAPRHVVYRNNIRDVAGLAAVERGFQIRHDGPGPTTLVGGNTSRGVVEDFVVIGNKATRFTGTANTPYQVFDDHNTPGAHAEYNWVTTQLGPNTGWGGCSTCTTSNLSGITATQPSGWDAVAAPPSFFCFEDNANPMHCEDREWPPYWCQEGADFRDVSSSIGAFSPTQGDIPAKIRANSGTCTLCDSVGGSGC